MFHHNRWVGFAALSLLLTGCSAGSAPETDTQGASTETAVQKQVNTVAASASQDECLSDSCTSLVFTGDFLVHNLLWSQAAADARATGASDLDFVPLIKAQRPFVERADMAVCQMETVVAEPQGPFSGYPSFNVPPQILDAAADIGWDVCMTASNHSFDQKTDGLERTYRAVEAAGMGVTGTNLSAEESETPDIFTTANGVKVAVVTGTYGLNEQVPDYRWQVDMLDARAMKQKGQKAREMGADIVVANMHAGTEYQTQPNKQQVQIAHELADSGYFDVIVGQHAHTVQPIEKHGETWIVYGTGNNVTEISPVFPGNNEGLMVNAVLGRDANQQWQVERLQWASSLIVDDPAYRYCITSDAPAESRCASEIAAQASYDRVKSAVESMDAASHGLQEWKL
ncbi:CapA family protein [Rothia sp. ZJ932]|uniref:CapA family protein n=1 Tax=Rothia sp. ZJ932 TaxID=2810516 RepID=UPI0019675B76|nr:CapA family protein [Rothia sp. ZJ932]QRZ60869.1 CapA family protein [Rothia sp. ZJ932]